MHRLYLFDVLVCSLCLQPPAPYYTVYPRATTTASLSSSVQPNTSAAPQQPKETLISRYQLQTRLSSDEPVGASEEAGGKAVWEDTAEKREASLRERKAKMILAARQYVSLSLPCLH